MNVTVNGEPREVAAETTVGDLLDESGVAATRRGVAVAIAGEVLARSQWESHRLCEGDRVEIVAAIQGG